MMIYFPDHTVTHISGIANPGVIFADRKKANCQWL